MTVFFETAKVQCLRPLSDTVFLLELSPSHYFSYEAGQYLKLKVDDTYLSFSIANAPTSRRCYELHIRHLPGHPIHDALMARINEGKVDIALPFGNCHVGHLNDEQAIIFIAGGTGFAPVKAMVESLILSKSKLLFEVISCARTRSDLYMEEIAKSWKDEAPTCRDVTFFVKEEKETPVSYLWDKYGELLSLHQFVLAGPFERVYSLRDSLLAKGVLKKNIYSDAFDFEGEK